MSAAEIIAARANHKGNAAIWFWEDKHVAFSKCFPHDPRDPGYWYLCETTKDITLVDLRDGLKAKLCPQAGNDPAYVHTNAFIKCLCNLKDTSNNTIEGWISAHDTGDASIEIALFGAAALSSWEVKQVVEMSRRK